MKPLWIAIAAALAVAAGAALLVNGRSGPEASGRVALGRAVYQDNCANCHGAKLEGQPDWRNPGVSGRFPAPPHDETGHTWHHSDKHLLTIITEGTAAVVGGGYQSDMPGFGEALTSAEIEAVLDYIKSTWPQREAEYQRRISNR